jgi:predicted Fe-Mo cluster-binding NifX family protein
MNIAFTAAGPGWDDPMDARFGRARYLLVHDEDTGTLTVHDNAAVSDEAHGAGPRTAAVLLGLGAQVLVTGNGPGGNAARALAGRGVAVFVGAGDLTVKQAYEAYQEGTLTALPGADA